MDLPQGSLGRITVSEGLTPISHHEHANTHSVSRGASHYMSQLVLLIVTAA
jgi:hypothetical protein